MDNYELLNLATEGAKKSLPFATRPTCLFNTRARKTSKPLSRFSGDSASITSSTALIQLRLRHETKQRLLTRACLLTQGCYPALLAFLPAQFNVQRLVGRA